jgi:subtilisin-like proprotein convertase family protein
MLQHQEPQHYSNPFIFGVDKAKLVFAIIDAAPITGQKFFFVADEDLNNQTIKGISLVDSSALSGSQFAGYNIVTTIASITMTLYNDKNNVVIDTLPVSILAITTNVFVPGRNGKKFKTKFKVNLGSSYVQWNGPPALITYPAVVPFMFYF